MVKKAKNLGKLGDSHEFQIKWINFNAKKGKKMGKIGGFKASESILMLKKAKNLGK